MSELRLNFLNWRPDSEDTEHDGLSTADNVIHEPEGYKPVHLGSAGNFSTQPGLAASNATVLSCMARPVGAQGDVLVAWIADQTAPTLHIGINGTTGTTSATGYPLAFHTAYAGSTFNDVGLMAFDVCEYGGKILWTVEANMKIDSVGGSGTTVSVKAFAGYMDY